MSTQQPLHEVQRMLKAFMDSKTTTAIDLKKVSQLVDVAIREHELLKSALSEIDVLCALYEYEGVVNTQYVSSIVLKALNKQP